MCYSISMLRNLFSYIIVLCLLPCPQIHAQELVLPVPGTMVSLSPAFNAPVLKGLKVHAEDPFRFDFIIDPGNNAGTQVKEESAKLIKYFLASLTTPEKELWVNLSPYEKERIVPSSFGQTAMGRDLLAQDYILKQLTASLVYPEGEIGKKFWKRVYEISANKNVPVNTFNKVWIVPGKAVVYENAKAGTAYVVESRLKVMTEQDYLATSKHEATGPAAASPVSSSRHPSPGGVADTKTTFPVALRSKQADAASPVAGVSQVVRETEGSLQSNKVLQDIVIPQLTKEVNEGQSFTQLRQVYNALILATWYKQKIKDSILTRVYADKNKIKGTEYADALNAQAIYQRYLQAFKKGAYNYIKEEQDPVTMQMIPRKYFSGGVQLEFGKGIDSAMVVTTTKPANIRGDYWVVESGLKRIKFNDKAMTVPLMNPDEFNALITQINQKRLTVNVEVPPREQGGFNDGDRFVVAYKLEGLALLPEGLTSKIPQGQNFGVRIRMRTTTPAEYNPVFETRGLLSAYYRMDTGMIEFLVKGHLTERELKEARTSINHEFTHALVLHPMTSQQVMTLEDHNAILTGMGFRLGFIENGLIKIQDRFNSFEEVIKWQSDGKRFYIRGNNVLLDANNVKRLNYFKQFERRFNAQGLTIEPYSDNASNHFISSPQEVIAYAASESQSALEKMLKDVGYKDRVTQVYQALMQILHRNLLRSAEPVGRHTDGSLVYEMYTPSALDSEDGYVTQLATAQYLGVSDKAQISKAALAVGAVVFAGVSGGIYWLKSYQDEMDAIKARPRVTLAKTNPFYDSMARALVRTLPGSSEEASLAGSSVDPKRASVNIGVIAGENIIPRELKILAYKYLFTTMLMRMPSLNVDDMLRSIESQDSKGYLRTVENKESFLKFLKGLSAVITAQGYIGKLELISGYDLGAVKQQWLALHQGEIEKSLTNVENTKQFDDLLVEGIATDGVMTPEAFLKRLKDLEEQVKDNAAKRNIALSYPETVRLMRVLDQGGSIDAIFEAGQAGVDFLLSQSSLGSRYWDADSFALSFKAGAASVSSVRDTLTGEGILPTIREIALFLKLRAQGLPTEEIISNIKGQLAKEEKKITGDQAQTAKKGGIDFNADKMDLETRNQGGAITFKVDPAQLKELQDAAGFAAVIISVSPLKDLRLFLGI